MHSNIFSFGELMLCSLIEMDKANKEVGVTSGGIQRRCGDIRNNDITSELIKFGATVCDEAVETFDTGRGIIGMVEQQKLTTFHLPSFGGPFLKGG